MNNEIDVTRKTHTPGPWARNISPKYPIYAEADNRKIAAILTGLGMSDEEAMANLKLVAAAPELLEALQGVLPFLAGFDDADYARENEEANIIPMIAAIRQAIAKATD